MFLWQLPQNIVGLIFTMFWWVNTGSISREFLGHKIYFATKLPFSAGGISLGCFVWVKRFYYMAYDSYGEMTEATYFENEIAAHGLGHQIQSKYFGPVYLIVALAMMVYSAIFQSKREYRARTFEAWADKLAFQKIINRKLN
jgi:hypothetical protein